MTGLTAAVEAVGAAVVRLRAQRPADDDDDEGAAVVKIGLGSEALAEFRGYPLTPVYREFLRAHSSHDFVDAGLRCGARAAWISAATSVLELTGLYRDSAGWAPHWLVCALDGEGCYVVDLDAPAGDDCPVLYVPPGAGKVQTVAPSFVAFLGLVARDSGEGAVREDRSVRADRSRSPGERVAAGRDDRGAYVLPVLMALLAAYLLWWMR